MLAQSAPIMGSIIQRYFQQIADSPELRSRSPERPRMATLENMSIADASPISLGFGDFSFS